MRPDVQAPNFGTEVRSNPLLLSGEDISSLPAPTPCPKYLVRFSGAFNMLLPTHDRRGIRIWGQVAPRAGVLDPGPSFASPPDQASISFSPQGVSWSAWLQSSLGPWRSSQVGLPSDSQCGVGMEVGRRGPAFNCLILLFSVCNRSGTEGFLGLLQPEQPGQRHDGPAAEAGTGVSDLG